MLKSFFVNPNDEFNAAMFSEKYDVSNINHKIGARYTCLIPVFAMLLLAFVPFFNILFITEENPLMPLIITVLAVIIIFPVSFIVENIVNVKYSREPTEDEIRIRKEKVSRYLDSRVKYYTDLKERITNVA